MRDNTKRNRNIGTAKQGHGQDNRLTIPRPYRYKDDRFFTEQLGTYEKQIHGVKGYEFTFAIESLRPDCYYPCTPEDVAHLMSYLPEDNFDNIRLIVFRQPTRKEEILAPVWARLIYEYKFEKRMQPAIVLEAFSHNCILKRPKRSLTVDDQNEFNRLQKDGHQFTMGSKGYEAKVTPENARNTQLYRSLPHEFGHYVHFLETVERPASFDRSREQRFQDYLNLIHPNEKEKFAHNYADHFREMLLQENIIPFESIVSTASSEN